MFHRQKTLNCAGKLLNLRKPQVMGILNVTPDSFYAESRVGEAGVLNRAEQMLKEGASILDIGGMSTRPGAEIIAVEEELKRVLPVIENIKKHFPEIILSLDTIHAKVAREGTARGVGIINDVSGGEMDEAMYDTLAELQLPYVLMHMQGTPGNMQQNPVYEDVILDVLDFFIQKVGILRQKGVKDIVLDPGFGFGKTLDHNYTLLANLHAFGVLDLPVLAGVSRKSMIYRYLETDAENALNGTTVLHLAALQQGANILRVHDVKAAVETIRLWEKLEACKLA
jgi:dihydropteroate synthase